MECYLQSWISCVSCVCVATVYLLVYSLYLYITIYFFPSVPLSNSCLYAVYSYIQCPCEWSSAMSVMLYVFVFFSFLLHFTTWGGRKGMPEMTVEWGSNGLSSWLLLCSLFVCMTGIRHTTQHRTKMFIYSYKRICSTKQTECEMLMTKWVLFSPASCMRMCVCVCWM